MQQVADSDSRMLRVRETSKETRRVGFREPNWIRFVELNGKDGNGEGDGGLQSAECRACAVGSRYHGYLSALGSYLD